MKRLSQTLYLFAIFAALGAFIPAAAQRQMRNIYLFDCTNSMQSGHLWAPAKDALHATIEAQTTVPGSEFVVVPFGDAPYETITFDNAGYESKRGDIDKAFDKYVAQARYTRITDVLNRAFSLVDPRKDNRIYLLTDGKPNGGDSAAKVAEAISKWCSSHRNCRLFYVALTPGVVDNSVRDVIDMCPDAYVTECRDKVIPQVADVTTDIYTSLAELGEPREILYSFPGKHPVGVSCTDSLFNVTAVGNCADKGKIALKVTARKGRTPEQLHQMLEGRDYEFKILVQSTDRRFTIANPEVVVHVADKTPVELTVAQGHEEIEAPDCEWYDSFLWSDAAPNPVAEWDLEPAFRNELPTSSLLLKVNCEEPNCKLSFNGRPLENGSTIDILPGEPAILRAEFLPGAKEGKHFISLTPAGISDINLVNGQPADEYKATSLRTEYEVCWNPLKTFLLWLAIALMAALLLWALVFKRIFFPTIKLSKVTFSGPGSYFLTKRIRGCRRVVFTTKRRSQNILSRLFTGEIRFVRADHFKPEIILEPAGGKKRVRVRSGATGAEGWDLSPSSIFRQYEKGTATNRATKEKFEIEFN